MSGVLERVGFLAREGFENTPPEVVCRQLSEIGYRAIEWSRHHFRPREMSTAELQHLVNVASDHGMAVSNIFIALDYIVTDDQVRADHIRLTQECIEAAADIGIDVVNVHPGPQRWMPGHVRIPEEMSEGTAWQMAFDAYDQILPVAEKSKVYLANEGVWGMVTHDYFSTVPLIERYDSPYQAITMDPSHGNLWRNDIPWVIGQWGKRIKHAHLKDSIGTPGYDQDTFIFPLLGEGQIEWPAYFHAMNEVGYEGYFIVEFESWFYYEKVLKRDMLAAARISYDAVKALVEV